MMVRDIKFYYGKTEFILESLSHYTSSDCLSKSKFIHTYNSTTYHCPDRGNDIQGKSLDGWDQSQDILIH